MDGTTSYPKRSHHIKQHYSTRYGVETEEVDIVVHALPMSGWKYVMGAGKGRVTLEKQWHNISQPFRLPGDREGHPGGGAVPHRGSGLYAGSASPRRQGRGPQDRHRAQGQDPAQVHHPPRA